MSEEQILTLLQYLERISEPTWTDKWLLVITAAALVGVVAAAWSTMQMRRLMKWRKAALQYERLYTGLPLDVDMKVAEVLTKNGLKPYDTIPKKKCKEIFDSPESWVPMRHMLNHYETICVAISANVVDRELAYNLQSNRVVMAWHQCKELCRYVRKELGDDEVYFEMEKWAREFESIMENRRETEKIAREKALDAINSGKGMQEI